MRLRRSVNSRHRNFALNVRLLPQIVQPHVEHLVHTLLRQQLANARLNIGQRHHFAPVLLQVGNQLLAVIGFHVLLRDMNVGTQTHLDKVHRLHFNPQMLLDLGFGQPITGQQLVPRGIVLSVRHLCANLVDVLLQGLVIRLHVAGAAHLRLQQFAVDQVLQREHVIFLGHIAEPLLLHEGLEAHRLVPITAQDGLTVDRGHDAVDHVRGKRGRCHGQQQEHKS